MKSIGYKALAGILPALAAVPAFAATIDVATLDLSRQGNLGNTSPLDVPAVTIQLESNAYTANDRLFLVLGSGLYNQQAAPTATVDESTCPMLQAPGLSVGFVDYENSSFQPAGASNATVARFRVTQRNGLQANTDATCAKIAINGVKLVRTSIASQNDRGRTTVPVTYFAVTGTDDPANPAKRFDASKPCGPVDAPTTCDIANVDDQFASLVVNVLDGVIDAGQQRRLFSATAGEAQPRTLQNIAGFPNDGTTRDTLALKLKDRVGDFIAPVATLTSQTATLHGDFDYLVDSNNDGVPDAGQVAVLDGTDNPIAGATVRRLSSTTLAVTVTAGAGATLELRIRFLVSAAQANPLNPTDFTADVLHSFTNPGNATAQNFTSGLSLFAGRWDINSVVVFVPWLPYQASTLIPIVQMTNKTSLPAQITLDAFDKNSNTCTAPLGTIGPHRVLALQGAIRTALLNCGFNLSDNRIGLTLTVTAPASAIGVYSAYDAPLGRTIVINSTNE